MTQLLMKTQVSLHQANKNFPHKCEFEGQKGVPSQGEGWNKDTKAMTRFADAHIISL